MAKRRTIGDNPLDAVLSPPPTAGKPGAAAARKSPSRKASPAVAAARAPQADRKPGPAARPPVVPAVAREAVRPPEPPVGLEQRVEGLEQENQCMRWLVGAILAPLALIALLA